MTIKKDQRYVGIYNDHYGGMTDTGKIIRDAWVFGLIPEEETCEGWLSQGIEQLWAQVNAEWEKYGFRVAQLPEDLQQRFFRIQNEAVKRAREQGWNPELDADEDD